MSGGLSVSYWITPKLLKRFYWKFAQINLDPEVHRPNGVYIFSPFKNAVHLYDIITIGLKNLFILNN